jgi:hypothetical protein
MRPSLLQIHFIIIYRLTNHFLRVFCSSEVVTKSRFLTLLYTPRFLAPFIESPQLSFLSGDQPNVLASGDQTVDLFLSRWDQDKPTIGRVEQIVDSVSGNSFQ